jgi:superfamily II DNA or RNA helicase
MASILEIIPEDDLKDAIKSEYKRKFTLYKITDEKFRKKYGMSFEEFDKKNIVKEKGFSWEVETDALEWEHSIEGMRYANSKLKEIETLWTSKSPSPK